MIVVKIELWGAVTGVRKEIGRMYITNRGTSLDPKRGNYDVAVCRRGSTDGRKPTRKGEVLDYPRLSYNVWRLITRALLSAFPEERKLVEKDHEGVIFGHPPVIERQEEEVPLEDE